MKNVVTSKTIHFELSERETEMKNDVICRTIYFKFYNFAILKS